MTGYSKESIEFLLQALEPAPRRWMTREEALQMAIGQGFETEPPAVDEADRYKPLTIVFELEGGGSSSITGWQAR